jgi:hypothetical protein
MALLGIVNIASSLPIHARFDVVAVKIYEERSSGPGVDLDLRCSSLHSEGQ